MVPGRKHWIIVGYGEILLMKTKENKNAQIWNYDAPVAEQIISLFCALLFKNSCAEEQGSSDNFNYELLAWRIELRCR